MTRRSSLLAKGQFKKVQVAAGVSLLGGIGALLVLGCNEQRHLQPRVETLSKRVCLQQDNQVGGASANADEQFTIDQIMRITMLRGLCRKVVEGDATPAEEKRLSHLLGRLRELTPPKGDMQSWRTLTTELYAASRAVEAGEAEHERLRAAANCTSCHQIHRP